MQQLILSAWENKGIIYYLVLVPLSWVFGLIVALRRFLYRIGLRKSYAVPVPTIVIGNINVGGSGKTPVVIWLAEQLKQAGYKPGVVSRGYGVNNNQPTLVTPESVAADIGDEPLLVAKRTQVPVCVSSNRVDACKALLQAYPTCNVILSDDGLQHYRLRRDIEIVVADKQSQANERLLPAGPLREPFKRMQEADFLIANGDVGLEKAYIMKLRGKWFYNLLHPSKTAHAGAFSNQAITAIAGIGKPTRFFEHLERLGLTFNRVAYVDHYAFTKEDLESMTCDALLMTEKDAMKCLPFAKEHHWVLPVDAKIDDALFPLILEKLKEHTVKG